MKPLLPLLIGFVSILSTHANSQELLAGVRAFQKHEFGVATELLLPFAEQGVPLARILLSRIYLDAPGFAMISRYRVTATVSRLSDPDEILSFETLLAQRELPDLVSHARQRAGKWLATSR